MVKGYKGLSKDMNSMLGGKTIHFEIGKTYEEDVDPMTRKCGIHFCLYKEDVFRFVPNCKHIVEVLALGTIEGDGYQYATNKIQIVREV